jgi:hypothetical protein
MAVLFEQSSLEAIVSFKEVSVVQSIDFQALQKLLARLSEGQAAANAQIERQQQELDALKAERQQVGIWHSRCFDYINRHLHCFTHSGAADFVHNTCCSQPG